MHSIGGPTPLLDTSIFEDMKPVQLRKIEEQLLELRKMRNKKFILPQQKQHFAPLKQKYIDPLRAQYLKPINDVLTQLRKHLPKKKLRYWRFDGKVYGPMTKKQMMEMICPIINQNNDEDYLSISSQ